MIKSIIRGLGYQIGKFLFYLLIIFILGMIFNKSVKAETIPLYDVSNFSLSSNTNIVNYTFYPNNNTQFVATLDWYDWEYRPLDYSYILLYACSWGNMRNHFTVTNSSYGASYFDDNSGIVANIGTCSFGGRNGNLTIFQSKVGKFRYQENSYAYAQSYFNFEPTGSGAQGIKFLIPYASTDDIVSNYLATNEITDELKNMTTSIISSQNALGVKIDSLNSSLQNSINSSTDTIINNQNSNQQQTNGFLSNIISSITSLFNFFTDDGSDFDDDKVSGMVGYLPQGPVDSILNLPLTFLNRLSTSIENGEGLCRAVTFPVPFVNSTFTFPCWKTILDTIHLRTFYETFGAIIGGLMMYKYLLNLYYRIHLFLSLKDAGKGWGGS